MMISFACFTALFVWGFCITDHRVIFYWACSGIYMAFFY